MLIKFHDIVTKYNLKPKGIVHIGAHRCEELEDYLFEGIENIIFFEAIKEKADYCKQVCKDLNLPTIRAIEACISDKEEEVVFNITNNGQSSSMLPLKEHLKEHPDVFVVEKRKMTAYPIRKFIGDKLSDYDFLNLDTQGSELKIMRGFGMAIMYFKAIYTEVNVKELYEGCALLPEMDEYLKGFGFKRVEEQISGHGWGDALYLRQ